MVNDQIHSDKFLALADYIYSANPDPTYVNQCLARFPNLKRFTGQPSGVIFMGTTEIIENFYKTVPKEGKYILIQRDVDRSYIRAYHNLKPDSVKHVFTVNCAVRESDITAIPIGVNTVSGENMGLQRAMIYESETSDKLVFCRFNTNPETKERSEAIRIDQNFMTIIREQIPSDRFYRLMRGHKYTLSLRGNGADCLRTWEALTLGSIPIVSDCTEMRHFQDMPMLFYPGFLTVEWLNAQNLEDRTTTRAYMSYWAKKINQMRSWIA